MIWLFIILNYKKTSGKQFKINEYQNHLFDLQTRYDALISQFEKDYPDYYNLKYQTNTASILEIQNQLPAKTALVEYFIGDSSIYIFTISKDDYEIHSVKKPSDFPDIIKDFYSSIFKIRYEKICCDCKRFEQNFDYSGFEGIKKKRKPCNYSTRFII